MDGEPVPPADAAPTPDPVPDPSPFTPAQIAEDGRNRVGRTAGQVGGATALVGLGQALFQARGWLHGELDPIVFGYYVTVVTIFAAWAVNRRRIRGSA